MDTSDFGNANYSQMLQAYHLRPKKLETMSKVYYTHTTKLEIVKEGYVPAATIALKKVGDKFHYGVAICSKYDNYSKKHGRQMAEDRLEKGFAVMDVPTPLKDLPDQKACLFQLYNIVASVVLRNRKWKKKVTKFNMEQELLKKSVETDTKTAN